MGLQRVQFFCDMDGFIKVFRNILNWEWYSDDNTFRVYMHCILEANYQDKRWQGIVIKRGQFVTSISQLSERLKLSPKQIRLALDKLNMSQNVTSKGTNKYTIITICNYDTYQDVNVSEGQTNGQTKDKQKTNEGQTKGNNIRNKEYKEIEEINIPKSNTNVLPKGFNIRGYLLSKNVDSDIVDAWLQIRKVKRASNTATAMNLIDKEVVKAGISWNDAICECVLRNWQGFKASWLQREQQMQQGRGRNEDQWTEENLALIQSMFEH